jgi:cobalt-zinc-cadmium efflux system membrane fusion protein
VHRGIAVLAAITLLLIGAGAAYFFMRTSAGGPWSMASIPDDGLPAAPSATAPTADLRTSGAGSGPLPDVTVPLTAEAIERAGIVVAPVTAASRTGEFRLPATVEPNAYRHVTVTSLVGGRVTGVSAQLGDRVRGGQALAQVYSPELAEAQTTYVSARARLDAHDRELQRTQKLVEIGAASRQELERIYAEHAAQTAAVQSARSRLGLLGLPASAIETITSTPKVSATISVPAPIDGVVTERLANVGLNIDSTTKLFTIVDLSSVWIVADVYEKDFSRVRLRTEATISTAAYPELALRTHVSYIDPQVNPQTRTAKVRLEVPNPGGRLKPGMYADVALADQTATAAPVIPRTAVQNVGSRTVVYLATSNGAASFIEREVRLGQPSGEHVEVVSGVHPGDIVVTEGSFFLRAERERLGLRPSTDPGATTPPETASASNQPKPNGQSARVVVSEQGFEPAKVTLRAGVAARITFVRTTDNTCGTELVFPSLKMKRALPLNEPVLVEFTPVNSGEIAFACGMNMLKGLVVVE